MQLFREQNLAMLQPGSIEVGLGRSEMMRFTYAAGEIALPRRHVEEWVRTDNAHILILGISDAALNATCGGISGEVELCATPHLVDERVSALATAVNAERVAGFPSGRLFLDSIEQGLAIELADRHAVRSHSLPVYQGGLTPARLRKVVALIDAKAEDDLSVAEMADTAGVSVAHFLRAFRKSTGESPHQVVLGHRIEGAKELLCAPEARVLDVALACGFKMQQHFARMFRRICEASPTEYRDAYLP